MGTCGGTAREDELATYLFCMTSVKKAQETVLGSSVQQFCVMARSKVPFILCSPLGKKSCGIWNFYSMVPLNPSQFKLEHIHEFIVETHGYTLLLYFISAHALIGCLDYD